MRMNLPAPSESARQRIAETAEIILRILESRHAGEIRDNAKALRDSLLAEVRRLLPVPAGRRRSATLDRAEALRSQGKSFHEIATILDPAYGKWGTYQRQEYRNRLKQGLRARKKSRAHFLPTTISEPIF
jgi:hypothetical protein